MDNSNYPQEKKVAHGIYITLPNEDKSKRITEEITKENTPKQKYIFKSTSELINILETEFDQLGGQCESICKANEDIEAYIKDNGADDDLIIAMKENFDIISKKVDRLREIQEELRVLCPTNPYVTTSITNYFKDREGNKTYDHDIILTGNVNVDTNNAEEILNEIDL
jgi:hypothetical protein